MAYTLRAKLTIQAKFINCIELIKENILSLTKNKVLFVFSKAMTVRDKLITNG